ncbi:MAG: DUF4153 domain-containing protein [Myxococcales bacterium]|nr:MAG: DUF4153 domain-containing protein [Myxococcales bacterium]
MHASTGGSATAPRRPSDWTRPRRAAGSTAGAATPGRANRRPRRWRNPRLRRLGPGCSRSAGGGTGSSTRRRFRGSEPIPGLPGSPSFETMERWSGIHPVRAAPGERSEDRASRLHFLLIGLMEGLVWWWTDPFGIGISDSARMNACAVFFVTSTALVARFTWNGRSPLRWSSVASILGAIVAAVTWSVWSELPPEGVPYQGDGQRIAAWLLGSFVLLYVTVPFAQIFQSSGRLRFPYPELFEHSWNNFFVGLVAALFTGSFWVVLGVWGALFNLIGIPFFTDLFQSKPFAYISTFSAVGYGLALGRAGEGVISTLRRITLMIAQALLPLLGLIALLFLAALPLTGLDPLWKTGSATPLVLALLAFLTLFLNGVFEEGREPPDYPRIVLRTIEIAVLLMPAYVAIALYGTILRVAQYGLTPERVYAFLFIGVASVYAVGYAAAVVLRRRPWIGTLKSVNVGTALLLALLAVLVQLPVLDPLRLSAESQASRLRMGKVGAKDFDFATLRFRLGHYGWEALQRLEAMEDHPERQAIRRLIERVRVAESFWRASESQGVEQGPIRLDTLPVGLPIPEGLVEAITSDRNLPNRKCRREGDCAVLGVDLDRDGHLEYCLLGGSE